jgi:preprotein translocase subunit SecG
LPPADTSAGAAGAVALSAGAATGAGAGASVGAGAGSIFVQAARPKNAVATAIVVNIFISLFSPCVFFTLVLIK